MVQRLLELANRIFPAGFGDWEASIKSYRTRETNRLYERIQDENRRESILSVLTDEIACVERFVSGLQKNSKTLSKKSLKQQVYAAFSNEDTNRVILSSVHKAKGREADRVFFFSRT